jgi:hypothetical protein
MTGMMSIGAAGCAGQVFKLAVIQLYKPSPAPCTLTFAMCLSLSPIDADESHRASPLSRAGVRVRRHIEPRFSAATDRPDRAMSSLHRAEGARNKLAADDRSPQDGARPSR